MTMPDERTRAVIYARDFLRSLLNPKETPRVPKQIRQQASRVLRHYPWPLYLDRSSQVLPDIWGPVEKEIDCDFKDWLQKKKSKS